MITVVIMSANFDGHFRRFATDLTDQGRDRLSQEVTSSAPLRDRPFLTSR